ncbi:hypothetical protein D3C80_2031090 [compost metagenome]
MGRTNSARCKDIIITAAQGIQCLDNGILLICDNAHFLEVDTRQGKHIGEVSNILVFGAA